MSPSPEIDLLETLASQNEKLTVVTAIFGVVKNEFNFERAKRVIQIYISSGAVYMYRATESEKEIVPDWEIRAILEDKTNWLNATQEPIYWLNLTDKGCEAFLTDSSGLLDRLFAN